MKIWGKIPILIIVMALLYLWDSIVNPPVEWQIVMILCILVAVATFSAFVLSESALISVFTCFLFVVGATLVFVLDEAMRRGWVGINPPKSESLLLPQGEGKMLDGVVASPPELVGGSLWVVRVKDNSTQALRMMFVSNCLSNPYKVGDKVRYRLILLQALQNSWAAEVGIGYKANIFLAEPCH